MKRLAIIAVLLYGCHSWPDGFVWAGGVVWDAADCPHPVMSGQCGGPDTWDIVGCRGTYFRMPPIEGWIGDGESLTAKHGPTFTVLSNARIVKPAKKKQRKP